MNHSRSAYEPLVSEDSSAREMQLLDNSSTSSRLSTQEQSEIVHAVKTAMQMPRSLQYFLICSTLANLCVLLLLGAGFVFVVCNMEAVDEGIGLVSSVSDSYELFGGLDGINETYHQVQALLDAGKGYAEVIGSHDEFLGVWNDINATISDVQMLIGALVGNNYTQFAGFMTNMKELVARLCTLQPGTCS
jgi:hypothetical protein